MHSNLKSCPKTVPNLADDPGCKTDEAAAARTAYGTSSASHPTPDCNQKITALALAAASCSGLVDDKVSLGINTATFQPQQQQPQLAVSLGRHATPRLGGRLSARIRDSRLRGHHLDLDLVGQTVGTAAASQRAGFTVLSLSQEWVQQAYHAVAGQSLSPAVSGSEPGCEVSTSGLGSFLWTETPLRTLNTDASSRQDYRPVLQEPSLQSEWKTTGTCRFPRK